MLLLWLGILSAPSHLIVLQHGLYGDAVNLVVLSQKLRSLGRGRVLVHLATSNEGLRTRDGIAAGGQRLAHEVRVLVAQHSTLRTLSLVGNSLGGLYVRHAAADLLEVDGSSMAGLEPRLLVTTGCPHLGVRRYTYLPLTALPKAFLRPAGQLVAGRTAVELLLCDSADAADSADGSNDADANEEDGIDRAESEADDPPLLVRMSEPTSVYGAALRAFRDRRVYANVVGDFMVPFGTAAIETAAWGAGVGDGRLVSAFRERADVTFVDEKVCTRAASGVAIMCEQPALGTHFYAEGTPQQREAAIAIADDGAVSGSSASGAEERMRLGLCAVSWTKVGVAFKGASTLTPLAHNKLAALRRQGWRRVFEWIERATEGGIVMDHLAAYMVASLED